MENDDVFVTDARLDQGHEIAASVNNSNNRKLNRLSEESPLLADSQGSDATENNQPQVWECQTYLDQLPWYKRPSVCSTRYLSQHRNKRVMC